ncbi:MAG: hypothetical protein GY757_06360 [bacterium]|nr:hypothetical protein [bacterium]
MLQDTEILAMHKVLNAFSTLDNEQMHRVVEWITSRFTLNEEDNFGEFVIRKLNTEPLQAPTPVEPPPSPAKTITPVTEPEPLPLPVEEKERDIEDFGTVLDLFSESDIKKVTIRILLMTAYLQKKHQFKFVSSYDINSRLKKLGYGVANITSSINGVLKKDPAVMLVIDKDDSKKLGRRKFVITEEGIKLAKSYINK